MICKAAAKVNENRVGQTYIIACNGTFTSVEEGDDVWRVMSEKLSRGFQLILFRNEMLFSHLCESALVSQANNIECLFEVVEADPTLAEDDKVKL